VLEEEGRLALDAFRVEDDPEAGSPCARAGRGRDPALAAPAPARRRRGPPRARGLAGWQEALGEGPPPEDAALPELDFANLHALSRLPGEDRVEEGGAAVAGSALDAQRRGLDLRAGLGRLWRTEDAGASDASGLGGTTSDLLLSGRIDANGFALGARAQVAGPAPRPRWGKAEARLDWSGARLDLGSAYLFLPPTSRRTAPRRRPSSGSTRRGGPSARWSLGLNSRYDVATGEASRTGLSVGWRNECVDVDVSVARRYTAGGSLEPSTSFGLSVSLEGFSAGDDAVAPGACG
jgi:LPS-assembly protein